MNIPVELTNRHPATLQVFQFFAYDHLPEPLSTISAMMYQGAYNMILSLPDGPELTVGLRKLLEAKDCFIRVAVAYGVNNQDYERPWPKEEHAAHSDTPAMSSMQSHPITDPNAKEGGIGAI